jgi:hypothetical protein
MAKLKNPPSEETKTAPEPRKTLDQFCRSDPELAKHYVPNQDWAAIHSILLYRIYYEILTKE